MGRWKDGVYTPDGDARGAFIRAEMRERYPRIEDELAVLFYGSAEERAEHAAHRAAVKEAADRRFPQQGGERE